MRKLALIAAAALATVAVPASASVIVGGNSYSDGQSFTVFFNGFDGGPTIAGLTSNIVFTVNSSSATQYVLGYTINNTSGSPITGSRVSEFGFNTDPNIASASASGVLSGTDTNGNVPNFGIVEVCTTGGGSCAGGGSGGVTMGHSGSGTVTLNFATSLANLNLSNFEVRYQSIAGANTTSATGSQIPGVPEPSTWAMMLIGFGAAGAALRRTKRPADLAQLA